MATLRQLRTRIAAVKNIQRVTKAMYMVAAAKMRRAQDAIHAARPYAEQLDRVLQHVVSNVDGADHPLLRQRPVSRVALAVVTVDRGLCGAFNTAVGRRALAQLEQLSGTPVELVTVGRKGRQYLQSRGFAPARHHADVFRHLEFAQAAAIAHQLTRDYLEGRADRVLLVFSEYRSVANQVPVTRQLLPIAPRDPGADIGGDYLFEPAPEPLLERLVPRHVNFQVWRALLEANAGFFASQMTAMDNASRNAGDLIEELTREMNKERQSSITLELMDIVGGAEAVSS